MLIRQRISILKTAHEFFVLASEFCNPVCILFLHTSHNGLVAAYWTIAALDLETYPGPFSG